MEKQEVRGAMWSLKKKENSMQEHETTFLPDDGVELANRQLSQNSVEYEFLL